MSTQFFMSQRNFATSGTTRYVTITTAAAQLIVVTSGAHAVNIFNLGSGSLIWGDSSIAVNSGNYMFANQGREWSPVQGDWSVYLRADSVQTLISITEPA